MGLIRKMSSVSTMGLVDYRSDKERIARSTRQTKQATKKGNKLIAQQTAMLQQQLSAQPIQVQQLAPAGPPAGWYADPNGQPVHRWWDGQRWTEHVSSGS